MWFALVTMTTVGYGDKVPVTFLGKSVTVCGFILGIILIALPVAIVGNKF
jgi:voltage-gated potassium channel Kch